MVIKLKRAYSFIGGHLLQNVSPDKLYLVVDKYTTNCFIMDDVGMKLCISNNTMKKFFKKIEV